MLGAVAPSRKRKLLWAFASLSGLVLAGVIAVEAQTPAVGLDSGTLNTAEQNGTRPLTPYEEARLGDAYLTGRSVPKDPVRAAYWYRKAADAGSPEAQNQLGYLYMAGIGLPRDEAESAKWFARAVAGGSQEGKLNLALIYLKGSRNMRDPNLGLDLLQQLAQKDHAQAEDILGVLYWNGDSVPKDSAAAEKWFERAAKHGNAPAQYWLGELNSIEPAHPHNLSRAVRLLRQSAQSGYIPAKYLLGILLLNHREIAQKSSGEAVTLLTRAAEAGMWQASAALGVLARDGLGMPRDIGASFRWFLIESKQGGSQAEQEARDDLATCRQALGADQQKQELQAADSWLAQHRERDLYVLKNGFKIPVRATFQAGGTQGE